jgi:hypothetical protein
VVGDIADVDVGFSVVEEESVDVDVRVSGLLSQQSVVAK